MQSIRRLRGSHVLPSLVVCALVALLAAFALPARALATDSGTLETVYLDPRTGSDEASGGSANLAVKTFERANDLLETDGTIVLLSPLRPQGKVTYSLEGKGNAKVVPYRHESGFAGSLLFISSNADVTLEHIIIDGGGASDTMDSTVNMATA